MIPFGPKKCVICVGALLVLVAFSSAFVSSPARAESDSAVADVAAGALTSSHQILSLGGRLTQGGRHRVSLGLPVGSEGLSDDLGPTSGWLSIWSRPRLTASADAIEFADTQIGEAVTRELELVNQGRMTLQLQDLRLDGDAASPLSFSAGDGNGEWNENDLLLRPGTRQVLILRFEPEAEVLTAAQLVATTNDLAQPVWSLPIQGNGVTNCIAAVSVIDEEIDFGNVILRASDSRSVQIENTGCGVLTIEAGLDGDGAFSLSETTLEIPELSASTLDVLFQAASIENIHRASLRLTTNDPERDQIEIPLVARSVLPAQVAVLAPKELALDFVAIMNEPDPDPFVIRIQNSGGSELRWGAETTPGTPWIELSPSGGTLAPTATEDVAIRLDTSALQEAGRYETLVRFFNEDRPTEDEHFLAVGADFVPFVLGDSEAPEIIEFGDPVEVDLLTWNGAAPDSVVLVYAEGGHDFELDPNAEDVSRIHMTGTDQGVSALIPADFARLAGVDWFIEAHSGDYVARQPDVPNESPNRLRVRIEESDAISPTFASGDHHMLSLPFLSSGSFAELWRDDLPPDTNRWRVGRYVADQDRVVEYPDVSGDDLAFGGRAYWFISAEEVTFDAFGLSTVPNDGEFFSLPLAAGQADFIAGTQVGTPFPYSVLWSDCRIRIPDGTELSPTAAADAGWIDSGLYDWRRTGDVIRYELSDRLEPWRGYFVGNRSEQSLELLIPARRASAGPTDGRTEGRPSDTDESDPQVAWSAQLSVLPAGPGQSAETIEVGMAEGASAGWDARDHVAPAPPIETAVRLGAMGHAAIGSRLPLSSEFRPVSFEIERWPLVVEFRQPQEVRLRIEIATPSPGRSTYLIDHESGAITLLGATVEVSIVPEPGGSLARLELVHGPTELMEEEGIRATLPKAQFALDTIQPSPFRDETAVRFRMQEGGRVDLSVFDAGGRLVRRLLSEDLSAGPHIARWDGRRDDGDDAPAGVYLLQLTQGDESLSRRLVRVK